jgi:hypothetical protein
VDAANGPDDAHISVGVAPVQRETVVQIESRGESRFRVGSPLKDLFKCI